MEILLSSVALVVVLAALLAVVASKVLGSRGQDPKRLPYAKRASLLSKAERSFFGCLKPAFGSEYELFAKVRIEDIVSVVGLGGSERASARGRIKSRHVDFVVCDARSLEPLAAIELDDRSHKSEKAREVDRWKDAIFGSAHLPFVRIVPKYGYTRQELEAALSRVVPNPIDPPESTRVPLSSERESEELKRISVPFDSSGSLILKEAPSVQLKRQLRQRGYRARKEGGQWIWRRN